MEINKAEFITSAVKPSQYPKDGLPAIALVGKSNVGKSSMINTITNRKKLAKTSGQPGKTRLINFYRINDNFYIIDLPGYGYARVSKKEKENWGLMIEGFLNNYQNLKGIIQLLDIRHNPTKDDIMMMDWVQHFSFPMVVLGTKSDKLGKTRVKPQIKKLKGCIEVPKDTPLIPFSSSSGRGKDETLKAIGSILLSS